MDTKHVLLPPAALTALLAWLSAAPVSAGTTIDPVNRYAWGANVGWLNAVADTNNGAVINDYYCSGYIWSANIGWINLGSGAPTNGIRYQNLSATDFGVNNDGAGNLSGYAWGANVGWIDFDPTGAPKVNPVTGQFNGYVWSANCGWINLSNAVAYVQTDHILEGPLAPNGLPIPWLLSNFGTTNVNPNADPTHKGNSIAQDYQAGTDPNNPNDRFYITEIVRGYYPGDPESTALVWTSKTTRLYRLYDTTNLVPPIVWVQYISGLEEVPGWDNVGFDDPINPQFFRVAAVRPLP